MLVPGLRVFATSRSRDTIADLTDLGIETLSLEVDQADSVRQCRIEVEGLTGGGLDYLVNNAGRSMIVEWDGSTSLGGGRTTLMGIGCRRLHGSRPRHRP